MCSLLMMSFLTIYKDVIMSRTVTLFDLLLTHANILSLDKNGRAKLATKEIECQMRDLLLSLFDTPHALVSSALCSAPLIPGGTYQVSQSTNAHNPEWLLLDSQDGQVCLPIMEFFNAFHDQELPNHGVEDTHLNSKMVEPVLA